MKKAIKKFLQPDWRKILILALFLFIAFAGHVQSWAFSGEDTGEPKPPFYDLFKPFPFWVVWVVVIMPLILLSELIVKIGGYKADFIMRGPSLFFWVVQVIYFYILSCLVIFIWDKLIKSK